MSILSLTKDYFSSRKVQFGIFPELVKNTVESISIQGNGDVFEGIRVLPTTFFLPMKLLFCQMLFGSCTTITSNAIFCLGMEK